MAEFGLDSAVAILCIVAAIFILFKDWVGADFVFLGQPSFFDKRKHVILAHRGSLCAHGDAYHQRGRRIGGIL